MTDLLVKGVRFALYADLMLLTGLAAFPLYAFARDDRRHPAIAAILARPLRGLCAIALLLSAAGFVVLTANMHGVAPVEIDAAMLRTMIGETDVGAAWIAGMIALAVALWTSRRPGTGSVRAFATVAAAGAVALATLAWSGHAGAGEGLPGTLHRASDAAHMIAAAAWLGAIMAFLLLLRPQHAIATPALAARSLDRFAAAGTVCVLVLTATGMINAQMIFGIGHSAAMIATPYGQLLLVKLLLFGAMLALAAANRWRLTPALAASLADGDPRTAIGAIRRSLAIEAAAGLAILALVAWLGTLDPSLPAPA
ncbi:copper resistance protein [Sphingopyxis sp. YF1]|uniref:copper homeostasis membrane protein CopD n=1 Tax=Sphingopyxis sp. YF1 TaxID=2482763 RepID=UPI001F609A67|nr:copper homeostasis membrane protein CopD [Sphingopyxis sp. YF1]UNU44084.1 copper resistance protein [Sphingopyxis sp. YF1]